MPAQKPRSLRELLEEQAHGARLEEDPAEKYFRP
jgi:hypothetical protein